MITLDKIQARISEEIKNSKLSQTEIAKAIGVNQSQISCYLHGKKMPALDTFANLCQVLDVSPAYLLGINND